jgi:ketosteroid isomerase-like protein
MKKMPEFFRCTAMAAWFLALILILAFLSSASAGQKKKKSSDADNNNASQPTTALLPNAVSDEIDHDIGEMLGAFQVGDVEAMHKYYADNATFVSGVYEPPVVGWSNYLPVYQRQKANFQGMQLLRRNTFIFNHGDAAWASYQWQFVSEINGAPYTAYGQTTLVFNKVGSNWLIVHNHTSQICAAEAPAHNPSTQPAPSPLIAPNQR